MSTSLLFSGGLTASLSVRDLDQAVAWYTEVLGFSTNYVMHDIAWAELSTPIEGVTVGLSQVESVTKGGGATLTWGVADIAEARAYLEERDVPFDGETQTIPGMVAFATFYDPDGNVLMLFQDLSES